MELSDYWRIIRKWSLLIVAGTVLATVIGVGLDLKKSAGAAGGFQASDVVVLNYTQPMGSSYNPTFSPHNEAVRLAGFAHNPEAIASPNPRFPLVGISHVATAVDPNNPQLTVTVTADTLAHAQAGASHVANYLAGTENRRVKGEAKGLRQEWAKKAAYDRTKWQRLQTKYNQSCGCLGNGAGATMTTAALARLQSSVQFWQHRYDSDNNQAQSFVNAATPPATITLGRSKPVTSKSSSPVKTILPAIILGFILSVAVAAGLDYLMSGAAPVALPFQKRRVVASTPRVPILGNLHRIALTGSGSASSETPSISAVARALGTVAGPTGDIVLRLIAGRRPILYVTSVTTSEPASETALAVASGLTLKGKRVVLVDGGPRGELSRFLQVDQNPGLTDYLAYPDMSLSQLLHPIEVGDGEGTLSVLPAGVAPPMEGDERAGTSWAAAARDLAGLADVILIDGGPAIEGGTNIGAAKESAGALLVLRRDRSDDSVSRAYEVLRGQGVRVLGLIVNGGHGFLVPNSGPKDGGEKNVYVPPSEVEAEYGETS